MPVPHQPPSHLPLASSLPKVSFRRIGEDEARALASPAGVHDHQLVTFGFNDGSEFEKPEHYIRHVEPIESELNRQVEYDMDEQDQEWLDAVNAERRREQLDTISCEAFEIIVDRLEKEWFDLMRKVPQKPLPVAVGPDGEPLGDSNEDIACAICDDGECENSNAIVFCDGCNLAVHQDCYGIPYIPEGQWLCRKCTVSPDRAVSCILCPHEGGAFKQTAQGKWAHLLCAMWIPETGVSNPVYMEPIDSVERIPKARWKLQCYICHHRIGACIQCDNKHCFTAFHVTCGRKAGLLVKSQRQRVVHTPTDEDEEGGGEKLQAWCHRHLPKSIRAQRSREQEFQDAHSQPPSPVLGSPEKKRHNQSLPATPAHKKSARAYKRIYRTGLSLVPMYVIDRVMDYTSRLNVRKKQQFIVQVAKFWSLKREARRGAPLLKRLHLEPWTANAAKKEQTDVERLKTLRFLLRLREDLEKVRMLAELVRKREKEKQRQASIIRSTLIEVILFPYTKTMRAALERIAALDRSSLFLHPVSIQTVPDYYEIIKHPMDWTSISSKLDDLRYTSVQEFKNDILLVLDNAMLYNKVDTPYHRTAARILHVAGPIFEELDRLLDIHGESSHLQLEPEHAIVELLNDREDTPDKSEEQPNAIEELTQQTIPAETVLDRSLQHARSASSSTLSKRAEKKVAQAERYRLAALKRRETRLRHAKEEVSDVTSAEASSRSDELPRRSSRTLSTRSSSLDTDQASLHGRRASDQPEPTDLEVKKVDNWDSFKRFNVGWVLPEGAKRTRNKPHPDVIGQTMPKDTKMRRSQSLISEVNVNGSDLGNEGGTKRKRDGEDDSKEGRLVRSRSSTGVRLNGKLDTILEVPQRRGSQRHRSTLSTSDAVAPAGNAVNAKPSSTTTTKAKNAFHSSFEPLTLCWAKLEGYPFFPAEVYAQDGDDVPRNVLESRPSFENGEDSVVHLVRFFDNSRSFGWVTESKLRLLFEDAELDERMIKAARGTRHKKDVRISLDRAKAQAE